MEQNKSGHHDIYMVIVKHPALETAQYTPPTTPQHHPDTDRRSRTDPPPLTQLLAIHVGPLVKSIPMHHPVFPAPYTSPPSYIHWDIKD